MDTTATIEQPTTPAPTTDTAPAAPATSAPASPSATSQRPSSFRDALERVAATPEPSAPVPAAAATVQPGTTAQPGVTPPAAAAGPIPFPDHQKILDNARAKTRAEVLAEVDRDLGWARQVPRQSFEEIRSVAQRMHADPLGFYQWFGEQLAQHPVYGPQMRTSTPAAASNDMPAPDVQIMDGQGHVTGMTYSADGLAKRDEWLKRNIAADFTKEIAPLRQAHERSMQEAQTRDTQMRLNASADQVLGRIEQILDGRKDLWPDVDRLMAADPNLDAVDAALQVRKTIIAPKATETAAAAAAETMRKKANGNTANGTGAVATPIVRPKNPKELAGFLANLEGARSN